MFKLLEQNIRGQLADAGLVGERRRRCGSWQHMSICQKLFMAAAIFCLAGCLILVVVALGMHHRSVMDRDDLHMEAVESSFNITRRGVPTPTPGPEEIYRGTDADYPSQNPLFTLPPRAQLPDATTLVTSVATSESTETSTPEAIQTTAPDSTLPEEFEKLIQRRRRPTISSRREKKDKLPRQLAPLPLFSHSHKVWNKTSIVAASTVANSTVANLTSTDAARTPLGKGKGKKSKPPVKPPKPDPVPDKGNDHFKVPNPQQLSRRLVGLIKGFVGQLQLNPDLSAELKDVLRLIGHLLNRVGPLRDGEGEGEGKGKGKALGTFSSVSGKENTTSRFRITIPTGHDVLSYIVSTARHELMQAADDIGGLSYAAMAIEVFDALVDAGKALLPQMEAQAAQFDFFKADEDIEDFALGVMMGIRVGSGNLVVEEQDDEGHSTEERDLGSDDYEPLLEDQHLARDILHKIISITREYSDESSTRRKRQVYPPSNSTRPTAIHWTSPSKNVSEPQNHHIPADDIPGTRRSPPCTAGVIHDIAYNTTEEKLGSDDDLLYISGSVVRAVTAAIDAINAVSGAMEWFGEKKNVSRLKTLVDFGSKVYKHATANSTTQASVEKMLIKAADFLQDGKRIKHLQASKALYLNDTTIPDLVSKFKDANGRKTLYKDLEHRFYIYADNTKSPALRNAVVLITAVTDLTNVTGKLPPSLDQTGVPLLAQLLKSGLARKAVAKALDDTNISANLHSSGEILVQDTIDFIQFVAESLHKIDKITHLSGNANGTTLEFAAVPYNTTEEKYPRLDRPGGRTE